MGLLHTGFTVVGDVQGKKSVFANIELQFGEATMEEILRRHE